MLAARDLGARVGPGREVEDDVVRPDEAESGRPVGIRVTGGFSYIKVLKPLEFGMTGKAIEAVGLWKFKPGMKDGKPVRVQGNIEVAFRLL